MARRKPREIRGIATPRLAPPIPVRSLIGQFREAAGELGISLMEWQDIVGRYLTGLGPNDHWLFRRVGVVVSRQNGKTEIIKPKALMGLKTGRAQLHIAQDRLRPRRSVFEPLADFLDTPERRELYGIKSIRFANGQEQILCMNGGSYTIVAPTSGGARGGSYDDIYVDEAREFEDNAVEGIIRPTTTARPNAQIVYFSSAGHDGSVVLNAIRAKRDEDHRLAYLEWSAAPERSMDDRRGWAEANPALGTTISLETLADDYASMPVPEFETEHLTRWVPTMRERLVDDFSWQACQSKNLPDVVTKYVGVAADPAGKRASAAIAWKTPDDRIALESLLDVEGEAIDSAKVGREFREAILRSRATVSGYNPKTDADLARYLPHPQKISAIEHSNATAAFTQNVRARKVAWRNADAISDDLLFTAKKQNDETGSFEAVRADDDRPITAALAAIRAVWLASTPTNTGIARIY